PWDLAGHRDALGRGFEGHPPGLSPAAPDSESGHRRRLDTAAMALRRSGLGPVGAGGKQLSRLGAGAVAPSTVAVPEARRDPGAEVGVDVGPVRDHAL